MKLQNDIILPSLTLQTGILGLVNESSKAYNVLIHILLVLDINIHYLEKNKHILNIDIPFASLMKIKEREKRISSVTELQRSIQ